MIDQKDKQTLSIPGVPKRRGRPPLPPGQAKTGAQRMADYRQRHKIVTVTLNEESSELVASALSAATVCRMLPKKDRDVLASLLQKIKG